MSEMFDNYPQPEDYIPNNRIKPIKIEKLTIMTSETAIHTFNLPINIEQECEEVEVIYKLGIKPLVIKNSYSLEIIINEDNTSTINCTLLPEETSLFANSTLNARVQIKFYMNDGIVTFSDIYPIKVTTSLENNRTAPTPGTDIIYGVGYGYTED